MIRGAVVLIIWVVIVVSLATIVPRFARYLIDAYHWWRL
jgi:hypothetical protein